MFYLADLYPMRRSRAPETHPAPPSPSEATARLRKPTPLHPLHQKLQPDSGNPPRSTLSIRSYSQTPETHPAPPSPSEATARLRKPTPLHPLHQKLQPDFDPASLSTPPGLPVPEFDMAPVSVSTGSASQNVQPYGVDGAAR